MAMVRALNRDDKGWDEKACVLPENQPATGSFARKSYLFNKAHDFTTLKNSGRSR